MYLSLLNNFKIWRTLTKGVAAGPEIADAATTAPLATPVDTSPTVDILLPVVSADFTSSIDSVLGLLKDTIYGLEVNTYLSPELLIQSFSLDGPIVTW